MKKLISLFLAMVMVLSITGVVAMATPDAPEIVIDGKKDADYIESRSLDASCWGFWDRTTATEPVDPARVTPTLYFTWDDDFVYLYFQAVSDDPLYKPAEGETTPPADKGLTFFEQINIYLDTIPSVEYFAPCNQGGVNDDGTKADCNHFCCNANDGEGKYYRLMARLDAAWDNWHNYYRSDEGVFLSYEEFVAKRQGEAGYEDLQAMYIKENGNGDAVGYADFETNTYGFEMKYPRAKDEDYFKVNITFEVNGKEWEEFGPELPYTMAICVPAWLNHEGMIQVWYEDYPVPVDPEDVVPGTVNAIRRMMEQLPTLDSIKLEHRQPVLALHDAYYKLSDADKAFLETAEVDYILGALEKVNKLDYIAKLGDINSDGIVNASDALVALRAAVGKLELTETDLARAEVNGDGVVSAKDALEILQFTVKKRTEFTIARTIEL